MTASVGGPHRGAEFLPNKANDMRSKKPPLWDQEVFTRTEFRRDGMIGL